MITELAELRKEHNQANKKPQGQLKHSEDYGSRNSEHTDWKLIIY